MKELWDSRKQRRDRIARARETLSQAADEVGFYRGVLTQLVAEADKYAKELERKIVGMPSYSLYPDSLASLRERLGVAEFLSVEVARTLGKCHFELSHLSQKLEDHKRRAGLTPSTGPA